MEAEIAGGKRQADRPRCGLQSGARDQQERERGSGIREWLVDEERRVRERGRRNGADGGEDRIRPRDDQAGEEVGREDRRRHQRDTQELDQGIRGVHIAQPPGRRGQVREQRDARRRLAGAGPKGRLAGVGDRARKLRELDLVAEEGGVIAPRRLPRIERSEHDVRDEERPQATKARRGRASLRIGRAHSAEISTSDGWLISVRLRTSRHGTPAAAHAETTAFRRSAGTSGIVTST